MTFAALALSLFLSHTPMQIADNHPDSNDIKVAWMKEAAAIIATHRHYPSSAVQLKQQGTVIVELTINPYGIILARRVVQSSGVAALDQEAVDATRRVIALPPLPKEVPHEEKIVLRVPIVFALHRP